MANGVNDRAFSAMETAASDKTRVDLFPKEIDKSTKGIHNALMAAGMTPALGNVADLTDAALYALEGEFGDAGWAIGSAIPFLGQMVAGKKALKIAKESGEEMVTLYRGVSDWYPGKMVKDKKFVSGAFHGKTGHWSKGGREIALTHDLDKAVDYANRSDWKKLELAKGSVKKPIVLEFEVPKKWIEKNMINPKVSDPRMAEILKKGIIEGKGHEINFEGMPVSFFKKVHK
tara:strand:+ start:880 stop:1572 length:693 start_codon:yes stop_codon:yes gene_type:complete